MATLIDRRPSTAFSILAVLVLLLLTAAGFFIAGLPAATPDITLQSDGTILIDDGQGGATLPPDAMVSVLDGTGAVRQTLPAAELQPLHEPSGTAETVRAFRAGRNLLADLARQDGTRLRLPAGQEIALRALPPGPLSSGAWLSLGVALLSSLAGFWVLVLRPREWPTLMFMGSGVALAVAAVTIAVTEHISLAAGGRLLSVTLNVNYLAGFTFGFTLVALFARFPRPLLPRGPLLGFGALLAGLWLAGLLFPWTGYIDDFAVLVLLLGTAIIALALTQGWLSRRDPAMRASFLLIGIAITLCVVLFFVANMIPQMLGQAELIPVSVGASSFLLIYLAIAVSVARYRLFDLGAWAVNVGLAALLLLAVLAADFAIVALTGGTWTTSFAFITAVLLWLPLREVLLRRLDRRRNRRDMLLLRGAGEVAFAVRPEQQQARWRELLEKQFMPLTVKPCDCARPEIRDEGRVLAIPSPLGGAGLSLGFAQQGKRLFNSEDRSVAQALLRLVREMVEARAAYDQGVQAERRRIARDLHDDVGARLMTTLHRGDLGAVQADVREAMADIRLIIDGMSGQSRRLSDMLADLRHELVNRLSLAGVKAIWPVDALFDDDRPVDALHSRALFSVVRELGSNIIRHAGAGQVVVSARLAGGSLLLDIADDGRGFDPATAQGTGNGLRNMARRVEEVAGRLTLSPASPGTLAQIEIPLASPERGMPKGQANG